MTRDFPDCPSPHNRDNPTLVRRVSIKSDGTAPGTKILVDGEPMDNVEELVIRMGPRGVAEVTLKLVQVPIDLDGQVVLNLQGTTEEPPKKTRRRVVDQNNAHSERHEGE